jgi:hypothetical protein
MLMNDRIKYKLIIECKLRGMINGFKLSLAMLFNANSNQIKF